MTRSSWCPFSVSLLFLTLGFFISLSHCAFLWEGAPVGLEATDRLLYLYRLATSDAPSAPCRRWAWVRSFTSDLLTWTESKAFLTDRNISYSEGGITKRTDSGGLLALAEKMECQPEVGKRLGVEAFTVPADREALPNKVLLGKSIEWKGVGGGFELGGKTFWASTSHNCVVSFKSITGAEKTLGWSEYGAFDSGLGGVCRSPQVVEVGSNDHLLSILRAESATSSTFETFYFLGNMTDCATQLKFQPRKAKGERLDWGPDAENFVFAANGSSVFSVGWIRNDGNGWSGKETWKGMTLIRNIEVDEDHIVQTPGGLDGGKISDSEGPVEVVAEWKKELPFSNEGRSFVNLTFQHSDSFKNAAYKIVLSQESGNETVVISFDDKQKGDAKDFILLVETRGPGSLLKKTASVPLGPIDSPSGNLLIAVGLDVVEVYSEGGKYVVTVLNRVEEPFTEMTIIKLGDGTLTLQQHSYWAVGKEGELWISSVKTQAPSRGSRMTLSSACLLMSLIALIFM